MKDRITLITIHRTSTLRDAMRAIDRGALGVSVVIDDSGVLTSVVTDGDIRRGLLRGFGLDTAIEDLKLPRPVTASAAASAAEVALLFSEVVRAVPIVDEIGRPVDIAVFDKRAHLPVAQPILGEKELIYVTECVLTGWVSSSGRFVTQFEEVFAKFCGTPYAITVANGTCALHLALLALGIGPGDEVIVPTLTFAASANTVVHAGARPVFVDSDPETWNLSVAAVEAAITPRTKAVMAVHLYGHAADMAPLCALCDRHGLKLIEDAAEAHGAAYRGRRVGSFGHVACFSFFGNKIVTTGEGGMIVTSSREIEQKCRILRDHGMSPQRKYWHTVVGYNYRMTNLQAALGVAQMERIDSILSAKRRIAETYSNALRQIPGLYPLREPAGTSSVYWLYSLQIDSEEYGHSRDELAHHLKENGIDTRPVFPVLHQQPIYDTGQCLPVAEKISREGISLPSDPTLSAGEIEHVATLIRNYAAHPRRAVTGIASVKLS